MSEPFIGEIAIFAGNFAPRGWHICDGALLPIAQYAAVFSILGTTYGGNGSTTFGLPDLRGRVAVGQGAGPGLSAYVLGQKSGSETVTLLGTQIPSHTHPLNASTANGGVPAATGALLATGVDSNTGTSLNYVTGSPNTALSAASIGASAGGGQPHTNLQPYLAINYIIALQGIFPSRS